MIILNANLTASQKGEIVELKCKAFLMEHGWNVSTPCGNFLKYDMVIEKNGKFYTIQCKKAIPIDGGFFLKTEHDARIGNKTVKVPYKRNDFTFFMTEFEGVFYMIPISEMRKMTFRTTSSIKNKTQRLANDYLAEKYLSIIESLS